MAERATCMVCLKEEFMSPCGANNECRVFICIDCKMKNDEINNNSNGLMDNNLFNCMICKKKQFKDAMIYRLIDLQENTWGINHGKEDCKAMEVMFNNRINYGRTSYLYGLSENG